MKMTDYTAKKLDIYFKKSPVVQHSFKKGKYTREKITDIAQQYSNDLSKKKFLGQVSVAIKYPEGWRSGYFTKVGDKVILYTHHDSDIDLWEDPEYFETFVIYTIKDAPTKGGCRDGNNNCLYDCLIKVSPDIKKIFPDPKSLKTFLKLKLKDKIDISQIHQVEEKLKDYKINVSGDHIYTSTKECIPEISLKLINGHYSIDKGAYWKAGGISYDERNPLIYEKIGNEILVFDGKKQKKISKDEYNEIYSKPMSSDYVLIPKEDPTLQETYDKFMKMGKALHKASDGKINLLKTGRIPTTAMKLFHDTSLAFQPEEIRQDEALWVMHASSGALIWAEEYTGPGYKYDRVSHYPSIMSAQNFVVPMRRGDFCKLTAEEFSEMKFYTPGIYRCIVKGQNKAWRKNKMNYYTHYDLTTAKELGFSIKLIEDDQPNALIYGKTKRVNAHRIFKEYIDMLFQLKKEGVPGAKEILNTLWGCLCQKNVVPLTYTEDSNDKLVIKDDRTLLSIQPTQEGKHLIKVVNNNAFFNSNYGRMMPFLLAKGRRDIFKVMQPHLDLVKRIHTDGFITTKKINVKTGMNLGDLKYEGLYKKVHVHNCMKVEGDFTKNEIN